MFSFKCSSCDEIHEGMPSLVAEKPFTYFDVAESERQARCDIGSDDCVIDGKIFLVRGCIEIPVHGQDEPFSWGVWVSLSEASYLEWVKCFALEKRSHVGPFFGWLNTWLAPYPDTVNLQTSVHFRDDGIRPLIELQESDHPLALEQRNGISADRLAEIYTMMLHAGEA